MKSRDKAFEETFVRVDSSLIDNSKYWFHLLILKGPFGEAKIEATSDMVEPRNLMPERWRLCEPNGKDRGCVNTFEAAMAFVRMGVKAREPGKSK
jgi:hypothetical protein